MIKKVVNHSFVEQKSTVLEEGPSKKTKNQCKNWEQNSNSKIGFAHIIVIGDVNRNETTGGIFSLVVITICEVEAELPERYSKLWV